MSWLSLLLIIKITTTLFAAVIPFLFFPKTKLEKLTNTPAKNSTLFRLYGVAIFALLVGYAFGIDSADSGIFPWGVIWMGTISNGGAALVLFLNSRNKRDVFIGFALVFVTLLLIAAMLMPDYALQYV